MAKSNSAERTTLSVKDFGPIAEATVELRPFTVFVGASNTGKSYLAILLYALHQFFGSLADVRGRGFAPNLLRVLRQRTRRMSPTQIREIGVWLEQTLDETKGQHRLDAALPENIAAMVRPALLGVDHLAPVLDADVQRCFGVATSRALIRQSAAKRASIELRREFNDGIHQLAYNFAIERRQSLFTSAIPADAPLRIQGERRLLRWANTVMDRLASPFVLADLVVPYAVGTLARPVHYLPADRAGVMHAHRVVVSSLIGRASRGGLEVESPLPALSGVLADFLERLIEMGDESKALASRPLAERLESEILGGAVRTSRSAIGYPSFHYRPAKWRNDLPLMNTSSMVSELAPVVLYLKHVVRPGDVLIIEEPESHLHPAMQVSFTRYLASVVKAGIRVVVTTHSEWVLEALANLVRLSEVAKSRRPEIATEGPALAPDEVGAWHFEPKERPRGSVVKEIPLDTVRGTFPAGFGEITEQLYNDWAKIANLVEEQGA